MVRYRNRASGRVITRSQPDQWLDASKRWERVQPLSHTPAPDREQSDGLAPEHTDDGDEPSGKE